MIPIESALVTESDTNVKAQNEEEEVVVDIEAYKPTIAPDRSWILSEIDLGELIFKTQ